MRTKDIFQLAVEFEKLAQNRYYASGRDDKVNMFYGLQNPSQWWAVVKDPRNWEQLKQDWQTFKEKLKPKLPQIPSAIELDYNEIQNVINTSTGSGDLILAEAKAQIVNNFIVRIFLSVTAPNDPKSIQLFNKLNEDLQRIFIINQTPIRAANGTVYPTSAMRKMGPNSITVMKFLFQQE